MADLRIHAAPGLHDSEPDAAMWAAWKDSLSVQERVVYRCLRWFATQSDFSGRLTMKQLAKAVGDPALGPKWGSRGRMPQTEVDTAIRGLEEKGLLEVQEIEDAGDWF